MLDVIFVFWVGVKFSFVDMVCLSKLTPGIIPSLLKSVRDNLKSPVLKPVAIDRLLIVVTPVS